MGKKTEFFFTFSENLTKATAPAFKWIVKHFVAILAVLAFILFVWRSIIHHFIHNVPIGRSLATAGLEIIITYIVCLLGGFIVYLIFKLVSAWITTLANNRKLKEEASENPATICESKEETLPSLYEVDREILQNYLNTRIMKMQYDEGTVFDEVVNTLKGMLKLHRKGSKSESTFSDIHFIQAATLLFQKKYQDTRKNFFTDWCISLFKALGLEQPRNIKRIEPEKKIKKLFEFLPKD